MAVSDNWPEVSWLADSPVFIDDEQIAAFYDAVIGPAFRTVQLEISEGRSGQQERSAGARLGAGLGALFPWLRADADVDTRKVTTRGRQEGGTLVVQPAESSTRQLVKLCLHYIVNQRVRICLIGDGGRPRWIDYRVTLQTGETLHLHIVARSDYDTGVFAYNLIRRGWRYGLRVVGSLKSQPALNVLAIYDK